MKVRLIAIFTALAGIAAAFALSPVASASVDDCSGSDRAVASYFGVTIPDCDDGGIYSKWKHKAPTVQAETFNGVVNLTWGEHYGLNIASRTGGYNIHRKAGDGDWKYVQSVSRGTLTFTDTNPLVDVEYPEDLTNVEYRLRTYISSNNEGARLDKNLFSESGAATGIDVAQNIAAPAQPSMPSHDVGPHPQGTADGDFDIFAWDRDMTVSGYNVYLDGELIVSSPRSDSTSRKYLHWFRTDSQLGRQLRDYTEHRYTVEAYLDLADGNRITSVQSEPRVLNAELVTPE